MLDDESPVAQLLRQIVNQNDDLAENFKALNAQVQSFTVTMATVQQTQATHDSALRSVESRLEGGQRAMEDIRQSVAALRHSCESLTIQLENVAKRDQDHITEIGKLWDYTNRLNVEATKTNTRISTAVTIGGVIGGILVGCVGYFGNMVIENNTKLAVLESQSRVFTVRPEKQ